MYSALWSLLHACHEAAPKQWPTKMVLHGLLVSFSHWTRHCTGRELLWNNMDALFSDFYCLLEPSIGHDATCRRVRVAAAQNKPPKSWEIRVLRLVHCHKRLLLHSIDYALVWSLEVLSFGSRVTGHGPLRTCDHHRVICVVCPRSPFAESWVYTARFGSTGSYLTDLRAVAGQTLGNWIIATSIEDLKTV